MTYNVSSGTLNPTHSLASSVVADCVYVWQDEAEDDKGDKEPGSLMSCLIEKKHHEDMNEKCRAGIEHRQLVILLASLPVSFALFLCFPSAVFLVVILKLSLKQLIFNIQDHG